MSNERNMNLNFDRARLQGVGVVIGFFAVICLISVSSQLSSTLFSRIGSAVGTSSIAAVSRAFSTHRSGDYSNTPAASLAATANSSPDTVTTPALPAGVTSTTTPTITLNHNFGLSLGTTLLGLSDADLNTELNDIQSLHTGWIRMDFDWSFFQPTRSSTYQWYNYDRVIKAVSAHGIQVLAILDYGNTWAAAATPIDARPRMIPILHRSRRPSLRVMRRWACMIGKSGTSRIWEEHGSLRPMLSVIRSS